MDMAKGPGLERACGPGDQAMTVLLILTGLAAAVGGLTLADWLASFLFDASQHLNPLHAGFHAWPEAVLSWRDGNLSGQGQRLAGTAISGVLLGIGTPAFAVYTFLEHARRRRLYGNACFASEADIRRAGLL